MFLLKIVALSLINSVGATFKFTEHDGLAALGLFNLGLEFAQNGLSSSSICTLENVAVRREWYVLCFRTCAQRLCLFRSHLLESEKKNYIKAIQCIHEKPALTPAAVASGAKSRYDDFVVTHVLQTYEVHGTVSLIGGPLSTEPRLQQ
jgi:tyrosinase